MNCTFELLTNRDDATGLYVCQQCGRQLPIPHKLASTVKRACTVPTPPPQEERPCQYRGDFTGKKVDCGCNDDTRIFQCGHPENAKQEAALNNPSWLKRKEYWACARCDRRHEHSGPIRVCFLTPGFWMGGAERWIASLAWNFDKSQVIASSVVARDAGQHNPDMIAALPRGMKFYDGVSHLQEAAQEADVLISWGCFDLQAITAGLSIPIIDVHHAANNDTFVRGLVEQSLRTTKHIAAVSDACRGPFGADWDKAVLLPNGADLARAVPRRSREDVRRRLGVPQTAQLVACVSRIMPDKRIDLLVDAVSRLPRSVHLLLAGPRLHYTDVDVEKWKRQLMGRLTIHKPVDHVGDFLGASDCFALASPSEAHSLAVNEAWLAGTPVAMFRLPWVEWLESQHGPMVYDAPRIGSAGLAAAIGDALGDKGGRAVVAKLVALERYTAGAMAARWEDYIRSAVG